MHADFGDQAEGLQISQETPIQVEDEDVVHSIAPAEPEEDWNFFF